MIRTTLVCLFVLTSLALAAQPVIERLSARSNGSSVTVEWTSGSENTVNRYEIERSSSDQVFRRISVQDPKGTGAHYRYVDNDAFMKGGDNDKAIASSVYQYRIRIQYKDNTSSYSDPVLVTHNVSSIRRTWGMIKEMFR